MEPTQRFVPKVHPATRPIEPEDPMTLNGIGLIGDPEIMLECLVQEYSWMGWNAEQILQLFHDPSYPALRELSQSYGVEGIRQRVEALVRQTGIFHVHVTERAEPEPTEPELELVELGLPKHWQVPDAPMALAEGSDHGQGS